MPFTVSQLIKLFRGAAYAVLLALAAVTPSLAEVGHLEDAFSHSAEAGSSETNLFDRSDSPDDKGQVPPPGEAPHCAFSHCAQLLAGEPVGRQTSQLAAASPDYASLLSQRPLPPPSERPEHPPRF